MLDDFLFGAATSAYQIEGAWNEDGKCPSIWDEISHDHKIKNNHTGDIACDHYHQWKDDVRIMKNLGLHAYRFSISWSRVRSKKGWNKKGIRFYKNLVDELIRNGIEPFVTLYHWDLPCWLNDINGWANPQIIQYFADYAHKMFSELPDVKYWITFNEPAVFIPNNWGHNNLSEAIRNVLLAHGKTVSKFHNNHNGKIGISLNLMPISPNMYNDKNDILAAENLYKYQNSIWLDPVFHGEFPKDINKLYGFTKKLLKFNRNEQKTVSNPIDFLGINYYTGLTVRYNKYKPPGYIQTVPSNFRRDEMGVEIKPHGLYDLIVDLKNRYKNVPEMYITENGCACSDIFGHDKKIHDKERIDYIREHLFYCNEAIKDGIKLKGYFYWSLMDNFEWLYGYTKRFGLLYIFYPNQARVCKDSYFWYRQLIADKKFRQKEIRL